ncbi:uncharacterized protein LTR77_006698 [Saxophila tyrrhenica]|uniref:Major facilitator superfamily (MFS) profile domain-containing protein n=1 Tax=Saxophila tyrrhenica TaxID=1690608 RepID=A0AAV9P8H9_9PEZI|nr:hypothetical protein LTR77_006698 [Saxophila tyrrhenica]
MTEYDKSNVTVEDAAYIEHKSPRDDSQSDADVNDASGSHDHALTRKIDLNLLPWLCLLYLASFLDRTNIGNAKVFGLQEDLKMTDGQWQASLAIFFVSYSIFEPVSNVLLKKLRPSVYLPTLVLGWGIVTVCQGVVHNFAGLAACRWFLGMLEAGLFPGCQFYLSCWYRRHEFGLRSSLFFASAALAGSFGGLLAVAITHMDGIGGRPGWAWIFIIEGLATVVIGIMSYFMIHDFPDQSTRFLTSADHARLIRRLREDGQASAEHESFRWEYLRACLTDWKTYTSSIIYMGCGGGLYAFSLFLPTILVEMGYEANTAQLMSVPPYAAAAIATILVGYLGDRTKRRGIYAIYIAPLGMIGFAILLTDVPAAGKYAGTFLAAVGIYPLIPNTICWLASNTEGVYKRGITLGITMGWANLQGCVVSNVYRAGDAPRFLPGHGVILGYLTLFLFGGSCLHYLLLWRENRLRVNGERDHWVHGKSAAQVALLGDRRPDFIYTL